MHFIFTIFSPLALLDIVRNDEKFGGPLKPNFLLNGFKEALLDSSLLGLDSSKPFFTWEGTNPSAERVQERLDRAVTNLDWAGLFPNANASVLVTPVSDHYSVLTDLTPSNCGESRSKFFCIDNSWLLEDGLEAVVKDSWVGLGVVDFMEKRDRLISKVKRWGRNHNKQFWARRKITVCQLEIDRMVADGSEITRLKEEWNQIFLTEEIRRKQ
uniref:Endonuclease/exonuclease/phosphatase domain-containing protein n=1 Tax=Manihot esculenta TaxID=3983 RepID=A0A2C9UHQ2_MANES